MKRPSSLPFARPAHQRRAERTSEAVASAALKALQTRDYEQISVAELAERAGISVGGFYARYQSKEALLPVLAAYVLDDCRTALDAALEAVADGSIESIVGAYADTMVRKFREHRHAAIQLRRHARGGDGRVAAALREFNDHVHDRLRVLLKARRDTIGHPDPDMAIEFGLFAASASAREAILAESLSVYQARIDDTALTAELTRAWVAYLAPRRKHRAAPRAVRGRRAS
jgi:AcrR family transcriptional regulator